MHNSFFFFNLNIENQLKKKNQIQKLLINLMSKKFDVYNHLIIVIEKVMYYKRFEIQVMDIYKTVICRQSVKAQRM